MTYILAEIASAHVGDEDKCKELVKAAYDAGADGVKVQIWQDSEIKDHPKYENLKRFRLIPGQWLDIVTEVHCLDIDLWIELIGTDSVEFAKTLRPDYWKIPDTMKYIGGDNTFRRVTYLTLTRHVAIGEQGYPTSLANALDELDLVKSFQDSDVLYADHSNIELSGYPVARMAKALGVWGIEKHICLNREELKKDSQDYISALEPDEFKDFVEALR